MNNKQIKISFITPSWKHFENPFVHQPFWELYYATLLQESEKYNYKIKVIDFRGEDEFSLDKIINRITFNDIFCYWIFKSMDSLELYYIKKKLKNKYPQSIHVAGGTHVEMVKDEASKIFDSIILGPGDNSFNNLVLDYKNKSMKKIYSEKWHDVDYYNKPYPKRSFLSNDRIVNKLLFKEYGDILGTLVFFSRGCMYKCSYCTLNVPNAIQYKNPEIIYNEIEYLKKYYKIKGILLKEEVAIHPNKKISIPMLNAIGKSNIIWRGQSITRISEDLIKLSYESGCKELAVGIETVDDNVMKYINKEWQNQKIITNFIEKTKKYGIKVKMCLILGLPGEPKNIVEKTIKFITDNDIDYVNVSGLCPMPGSDMYANPKKYGIKFIDKNWSNHTHLVYRYSDEEKTGIPFEYETYTPMGKSMNRNEIIENIRNLQNWLKLNKKSY